MSQTTPGRGAPPDAAAAAPQPEAGGDAPDTAADEPGSIPEWLGGRLGTAVFSAAHFPEMAAPAPPAPPRQPNRLVVVLAAAIVLLLAAGGVLTALLISTRSAATDLATAEAAEDREHEQRMADFADTRAELDQRYAAAESDTAAAEQRIEDAEAGQRAAQEQVAAREQADASAAAADEQTFVDAMRAADAMPGVPDGELLTRGRDVCAYLDPTPGTPVDVSDAFDRAADTYAVDDAILLVTAATGILCPEYA